jgi:hypothetical protein
MKTSSKSLWAILFVGLSFTLSAQSIHTGFLSGVAISGYDTVAFYTQGQAVKGSAQFSARYQGATWQDYGEIWEEYRAVIRSLWKS